MFEKSTLTKKPKHGKIPNMDRVAMLVFIGGSVVLLILLAWVVLAGVR